MNFTESDAKYYHENGWYGALKELCEEKEEEKEEEKDEEKDEV